MVIYTKLRIRWIFTMFAIAFLTAAGFGDISKERAQAEYQKSLTITVKALKDVYEPGEPVPLVVAIANHGSEPVYIVTHEPGILDPYIRVKDANGVEIMRDPVPAPPPPPPSYYMEREGKRIFTVPVFKIGGPGVVLAVIADALTDCHKHVSEGNYYFTAGITIPAYEESSLIFREDLPHQLWVDPQPGVPQLELQSNTVKIQIRRKPAAERPKPLLFAWPSLLISAVAGMGAVYLILLLKKKASSRGKSRAT